MININALVIIPAKSDSTRLPGKNKRIIAGKTLVEHAILYSQSSNFASRIIVTTEDKETADIATSHGVDVIGRDLEYMGEREVADVYINIFNQIDNKKYTHVVGVQPDHPDRTVPLDEMLKYAVDNKYDDLFTINKDGSRNGSIRITRSEHVKSGNMSRRVGSMFDFCTNIHTENDLITAEKNIYTNLKGIELDEKRFGKNRFPESYQTSIGSESNEELHDGTRALIKVLKSFNVLDKEGMSICEIGSGPGRNLDYIYRENNTVKLYANDLWDSSIDDFSSDLKRAYESGQFEFTVMDTAEYMNSRVLKLDLFMTVSHMMHLEWSKGETVLNRVCNDWKPEYILICELRKEFENPKHPYMYHDYDKIEEKYTKIYYDHNKKKGKGFYALYKRKE